MYCFQTLKYYLVLKLVLIKLIMLLEQIFTFLYFQEEDSKNIEKDARYTCMSVEALTSNVQAYDDPTGIIAAAGDSSADASPSLSQVIDPRFITSVAPECFAIPNVSSTLSLASLFVSSEQREVGEEHRGVESHSRLGAIKNVDDNLTSRK